MGNVTSMGDQQEATLVHGRDSGLDIENSEDVRIAVDESLSKSYIMEQMVMSLEEFSSNPDQFQTPKPRIQKVSSTLRNDENFRRYFEPKVVAIGPLHHYNPVLQAAEKIKFKLAGVFINGSGIDKNELYNNILDNIENLKECYDEKEIEKYSNEELASILLVDGCAVLQYIDRVVNNQLNELKMEMHVTHHVLYINEDIFLVENQLPYLVLDLLMRSRPDHDLKKSVTRFIYMNSMAPEKEKMRRVMEKLNHPSIGTNMGGGRPQGIDTDIQHTHHLLDLLRQKLLQHYSSNFKDARIINKMIRQLRKEWLPFLRDTSDKQDNIIYDWRPFHTAKELKAVGIHLKPSISSCLLDISFSPGRFSGSLILPPIVIDSSAVFKFFNMIAFEMFPDYGNDFEVTSYMCFLASFIAHEEDVQELRSAGILYNRFGSDKEVRRLLHNIAASLMPNPDAYKEVKNDIQAYFANRQRAKIATWVVDVKQEYFRNPWSVIAVIAAAFAILVSVVQTYYTIFPL